MRGEVEGAGVRASKTRDAGLHRLKERWSAWHKRPGRGGFPVDRRSSWLPIVLTCLGLFLLPRAAVSAPKDAAATKIAEDAINNDYLALHFNEAAKKLKSAVAM